MDKKSIFDILPNRQIPKRGLSKSETVPIGSVGKRGCRSALWVCESALVERVGQPGFLPVFRSRFGPRSGCGRENDGGLARRRRRVSCPNLDYVIRVRILSLSDSRAVSQFEASFP